MPTSSTSSFLATPDGLPHAAASRSGWRAELALRFEDRCGRSVLASRRQHGPLLVQRPFYPEGDGVCHAYLLHPPAGIVGGDDLTVTTDVGAGAHALVTTPAATRWYFSRSVLARARQEARVEAGGTLEWLPQETLLFDGAHARLVTRIALAGNARFLGWEILGFGRPACGERFLTGSVDFSLEVDRDGEPLVRERLRGGTGGIPGLGGHAASATLIAAPAGPAELALARDAAGAASDAVCAATLIGDVLLVRGLADYCEPLVARFKSIWSALRPTLLGRSAAAPRIWRT
jgi:urease accessory protein